MWLIMKKILWGLLFLFSPIIILAHPHAWIYTGSTFLVSNDGKLMGIKQRWHYDNLLTDVVLQDLNYPKSKQNFHLDQWAKETLRKLAPYDYFLKLSVNGQSVPLSEVAQYRGELIDETLVLSFTMLLSSPIDIKNQNITLAAYDPSFYIEILQSADFPPQIEGLIDNCRLYIEYPEPTADDFLQAAMIDYGVQVDPQFGELFAEIVHLECTY